RWKGLRERWSAAVIGAIAIGAATAASGCTIYTTRPAASRVPPPAPAPSYYPEVASEPAPYVPPNIEVYPRTLYRGRYAYLVDGRWSDAGPRGWVILREEPRELARYRTSYRTEWTIGGYPVVRTMRVPVDIGRYPRVPYGASYAYLVDGRWYFAAPERWVTFREEPLELSRYRVQ